MECNGLTWFFVHKWMAADEQIYKPEIAVRIEIQAQTVIT